ncbi:MAG: hypothetical protein JOY68_08355, partial [Candidatus Dormibacteraeota bacterium]|nr:hypothetical protein [Candidatus Dormibacteraeota bacterium]
KGYMQTYLYHMRHPVNLYRHVGWRSFLAFHLFFGANSLILLLNPLYWAMTAAWYVTYSAGIQALFPAPILYLGTIALFAGNAIFTVLTVIGCMERRNYRDVKWALCAPVYWLLMSVGAWKALLQLITKPYYWEKTVHGYCLADREVSAEHPVSLDGASLIVQEAS